MLCLFNNNITHKFISIQQYSLYAMMLQLFCLRKWSHSVSLVVWYNISSLLNFLELWFSSKDPSISFMLQFSSFGTNWVALAQKPF